MSTDGHDRSARPQAISFAPALPDGADCPWTRDRRTRWWLVVPADLVAVALVALFGAASTRTLGQVITPLWQAAIAVAVAWAATWCIRRRRPDHLEMALPDGLVVVGLTWATWTVLRELTLAAFSDVPASASWALMTGTFLLVFLGGWRWLYGYVRAHDSLTPKPVARRLAEQAERQEQEGR
ncbi:DUF3054 family protein [Actinomyces sp. ZJ308]|uniref:DUF3054 family protein n=1 Tax=Actinomyces sp. ZJ308 TaxID=2708342 RepID=UPI00141F03C0|nr:DUF3054 family protein [Actinomyces sp. ZJ308]